jgi:hypothetical protein
MGLTTAASLNNLGMIYGSTGRDTEAEPLYRRALAILEKLDGLDSAEVAPELNNLAALYAAGTLCRGRAVDCASQKKIRGPDAQDRSRS